MRLKFTFSGQSAVVTLPREATWQDAHDSITEKLHGLPPLAALSAQSGFPPQPREVAKDSSLQFCGISNGSSVTLTAAAVGGVESSPTTEPPRQSDSLSYPGATAGDAVATPTPHINNSHHTVASSAQWSCSACTFINEATAATCAVCETPNPGTQQQPSIATPSSPASVTAHGSTSAPHMAMERVVVPADNNCLYTAVAWLRTGAYPDKGASMRQAAADQIELRAHGLQTAALDGMIPAVYQAHVLKQDSSWGGAFELQLLAAHFGTTFVLLNIQTGQQMEFSVEGLPSVPGAPSPPPHDGRRAFVLYDGLHFDAVGGRSASQGGGHAQLLRDFAMDDTLTTAAAGALVQGEQVRRAFTDTARYTLCCLVCQQGLTGNDAAVKHAQSTGHTNFAEYS